MKATIEHGPVFSSLKVELAQGESFKAEPGAMISMSTGIGIKSKASGKGILGTLKAAVGGESLFTTLYTAEEGPGEIVFAPASPGDILRFDLEGKTVYAQGGAYMAGSPDLELSTKGSAKALFSGEGLFLQKITGNGSVFLSAFGAIYEVELKAGDKYRVDTGHIIAFEESVTYTIKKAAKGILATLTSGEGLVCEYSGPGKLWVQTRNLKGFAGLLNKMMTGK